MSSNYLNAEISNHIWKTKYRYCDGEHIYDQTIEDTWRRVAKAIANVEINDKEYWEQTFYNALEGFKFIPGGRILAGAGTQHRVTLFNCFVMGTIHDSMESIFENLKEGALTMQQGGGVGYDFSNIRPSGFLAKTTGTIASGPISFMRIWDSTCATLLSTGARRGAMMATLRCDHPDIEEFIGAKHDRKEFRHFNLSVQVSNEFIQAIRANDDWPLIFPVSKNDVKDQIIMRRWSGHTQSIPCKVIKTVKAKSLWEKIMCATYEYAEPGVLFVDTINNQNNLWYQEHITTTNPCGEIPLPAYGACNLGAINLTQFVLKPFTNDARLDFNKMREITVTATRFLDNVIDASNFPLAQQKKQVLNSRRIGLGVTGLADTLIMLGMHYGKQSARDTAAKIMSSICKTAYQTSVSLAKEKGAFPTLVKKKYLSGKFIKALPEKIKADINKYGIRNSHLTTIAPTGTTSILANNISSGIEPVFDFTYIRKVLELDGAHKQYKLQDYAYSLWKTLNKNNTSLPNQFINAKSLSPVEHLKMQAALQPHVDNAISKTINIPENYPYKEFKNIYLLAYENNLKGCTTFRPNPISGSLLT